MNQGRIEEQLIAHEGERLKVYPCPAGFLTIGVGRNLEGKGITRLESRFLLKNDIAECYQDLSMSVFPGQFEKYPENIQHALMDMRFQLGMTGFRKFKNMIICFKLLDYEGAIREMMDSLWYDQTKGRANRLIDLVRGRYA